MAWHKLTNPTEVEAEFRKKSRILIDESLGIEVALREKGYNAVFVGEVGLAGRSDDDVFAFAWRNRRMVWTHDRDFLTMLAFLNTEILASWFCPGLVVTIRLCASALTQHYLCLDMRQILGTKQNP